LWKLLQEGAYLVVRPASGNAILALATEAM
jgi:hypothetical protein